MPDYRAMYFTLAGKVADAIAILVEAQIANEEAAMQDEAALKPLDDETEG